SHDDKNRCILWLWGKTETNPEKGWNNCFVMPRILTIGPNGHLRQNPAPEFETLRGKPQVQQPASINDTSLSSKISGDCLGFQAALTLNDTARVAPRVRGGTEIAYNAKTSILTVGSVRKMIGTDKTI